MLVMGDQCFFAERYGKDCESEKEACSNNRDPSRIKNIIEASNIYGYGLCKELVEQFALDQNRTIAYHKNCVSKYNSKTNLFHHSRTHRTAANMFHARSVFVTLSNCLTLNKIVYFLVKFVAYKKTAKIHQDGILHS